MREIIFQVCTAVGAIVLVYVVILVLIFITLYVSWYLSDDRKKIDREIYEGDDEDDFSELTIDDFYQ